MFHEASEIGVRIGVTRSDAWAGLLESPAASVATA